MSTTTSAVKVELVEPSIWGSTRGRVFEVKDEVPIHIRWTGNKELRVEYCIPGAVLAYGALYNKRTEWRDVKIVYSEEKWCYPERDLKWREFLTHQPTGRLRRERNQKILKHFGDLP